MKVVRVPSSMRQYFSADQLSGLPTWYCYSSSGSVVTSKSKKKSAKKEKPELPLAEKVSATPKSAIFGEMT